MTVRKLEMRSELWIRSQRTAFFSKSVLDLKNIFLEKRTKVTFLPFGLRSGSVHISKINNTWVI